MRETVWVWLGFALLLAAAALLLWRQAVQTQLRRNSRDFLERRINAHDAAPPAAAPTWRGTTGAADAPDDLAARLGNSPWMQGANVGAATANGAGNRTTGEAPRSASGSATPSWLPALPARLESVITLNTIGLASGVILILSLVATVVSGALAGGAAFLVQVLLGVFLVWLRLQALHRRLVQQLPTFIDSVVRLIAIGNSTQSSFQIAIESTRQPLQGCLERAATLVRAGVDLDRALQQVAVQMDVEELLLLASILGLGVRYGGRADLLLERVAAFMRDHEQAEHELQAMSAETRMSAWVLGLLPVGVGGMIIMISPAYFLRMWNDSTGQWMIFGAVGLQLLGVTMLYRLARLE